MHPFRPNPRVLALFPFAAYLTLSAQQPRLYTRQITHRPRSASATQYMTRRRWDYFARYLAGGIPQQGYEMKPYSAAMSIVTSVSSDDLDLPSDPE